MVQQNGNQRIVGFIKTFDQYPRKFNLDHFLAFHQNLIMAVCTVLF